MDDLSEFLENRAAEVDEQFGEWLEGLACDLREIPSDFVKKVALWEAAKFSDHPDYRSEWTPKRPVS